MDGLRDGKLVGDRDGDLVGPFISSLIVGILVGTLEGVNAVGGVTGSEDWGSIVGDKVGLLVCWRIRRY